LLWMLAFAWLLSSTSCGTKKYLKPGETFLDKNTIIFENSESVKNKRNLRYELSTIYKQKPNEKFLFTPMRLGRWYYYRTNAPSDTSWFKRFLRNNVAELPSIYDNSLSESTAKTMEYYLHNKGYFDAKVSYKPTYKKHKTYVTYFVSTNPRYTIDTIDYTSSDPRIERILRETKDESQLQQGKAVSEGLFNKEMSRIISKLQNMGYAYFDKNFISPIGFYDTVEHKVNILYEILPPKDTSSHRLYTIGDISVTPRYDPTYRGSIRDSMIEGIHFRLEEGQSIVRPQTIIGAIQIRQGDLYSIQQLQSTNNQLGNLEIYKFISIKYLPDSIQADKLNVEIQLTPRKKSVAGFDAEINNSSYSITETPISLLGTSFNMNYKNRNLFRSAVILNTRLSTSVEWNLTNSDQLIYSSNLSPGIEVFIPKFKDLNLMWGLTNRLNLLRPEFYNQLRDKSKTRLSFDYSYVNITDFYNYNSFNGFVGYDLKLDNGKRFRINTIGANYLRPDFQARFDTIRNDNEFLARSFTNQLFTGFLFRDLNFNYAGKPKFGRSYIFNLNLEVSGAEILGINQLANAISGNSTAFKLGDTNFEQYVRLQLDLRHYWDLSRRLTLAHRFNIGIATPFGPYSQEVPYVKQFAAGGANSIRAWEIRELGPGAFFDSLTVNNSNRNNTIFYQAGDFQIEFNQEWRFPIFSVIEGAFFVDVGNVWTLREDDRGPDAVFGKDFFKQLAIGSGLGIRFDFNYFLFRFDFGVKVRKPFIDPEVPGDSHWLFKEYKNYQFRDINPNLAIGYSF
ncbi:MAG: BamA/TamA family outer membrane protein, partial [Bacteroidota bacterium]